MRHRDSLTAQAMATTWRRQYHHPIGGRQHLGRARLRTLMILLPPATPTVLMSARAAQAKPLQAAPGAAEHEPPPGAGTEGR
jgi:hypothetical protein